MVCTLLRHRGIDFHLPASRCQANHDTHTSKTNKVCGVQGALVVYSVLSFELWWLSLIGNLCYTLYLKKRFPIPDLMLELFMHSINWVRPKSLMGSGYSYQPRAILSL